MQMALARRSACAALFALVAACGGGGGETAAPAPAPSPALPAPEPATLSLLAGSLQTAGGADGVGTLAQFNGPLGVTEDAAGFVYVADTGNHTIRRIAPDGAVTTLAGKAGESGAADGLAGSARFSSPKGVVSNAAGELFVTDASNCTLRKISPAGVVSTLAGTAGRCSSVDGAGAAAGFSFPWGIALDAAGSVLVGDGRSVRKVSPAGVMETLVNCGPMTASPIGMPPCQNTGLVSALAVDGAGNIFIGDAGGGAFGGGGVSRVDAQGRPGAWPKALRGSVVGVPDVWGLVALDNGEVIASSRGTGSRFTAETNSLARIDREGVVTTLAGANGALSFSHTDGPAATARFYKPAGLARGARGRILVADTQNHAIRQLDALGNVGTVAGGSGFGYVDAAGAAARFNGVGSITAMTDGTLRVGDLMNGKIRSITPAGVVSTSPAGLDVPNCPGAVDSVPRVAASPDGRLYAYRDTRNCRGILDINESGPSTLIAEGYADITAGPGGTLYYVAFNGIFRKEPGAAAVGLWAPTPATLLLRRMTVDAAGNIYFTNAADHAVHVVDKAGAHRIHAGSERQAGMVDGPLTSARFESPHAVTMGPGGVLYVSDVNTVRRIAADGTVTTLLSLAQTPIKSVTLPGQNPPHRVQSGVQSMVVAGGFLYLALNAQSAVMKYGPLP